MTACCSPSLLAPRSSLARGAKAGFLGSWGFPVALPAQLWANAVDLVPGGRREGPTLPDTGPSELMRTGRKASQDVGGA